MGDNTNTGILGKFDPVMAAHVAIGVLIVIVVYHFLFHR